MPLQINYVNKRGKASGIRNMKVIICFRRMRNCPQTTPDLFSDNSLWTEGGASAGYTAAGELWGNGCAWPAPELRGLTSCFGDLCTWGWVGSTVPVGARLRMNQKASSPHAGTWGLQRAVSVRVTATTPLTEFDPRDLHY